MLSAEDKIAQGLVKMIENTQDVERNDVLLDSLVGTVVPKRLIHEIAEFATHVQRSAQEKYTTPQLVALDVLVAGMAFQKGLMEADDDE